VAGRGMRRLKSLVLILPLLIFLLVFFIAPLGVMMRTSISDPVATQTLPQTAIALSHWDRASVPDLEIHAAFIHDIRALEDDEQFGDLVRRLNSAQSGFRSLMARTRNGIRENAALRDLAEIDVRWEQLPFWHALADASASPWTDKNLLAALDYQRDASGNIVAMPSGSSANSLIMGRTFLIATLVTLCCLGLGLPFALVIASTSGWKRQILLGAVLLPLWTSLLVRTAAWFVLLQDRGIINAILQWLGLIDEPLALIFNRFGVVIAMTHVLLPFMVLPIFSVLVGVPKNLMPAAASLGAHPLKAFFYILLPLTMRGVISGSLLVFMTALGYYITPALIGGANDQMVSSIIAYYATGAANWGMAGALGLVLLTATLVLYAVYMRFSIEEKR